MKKICGIIFSVILGGALLTSFSPSLDGRAVVAADGVMPKGVFAKTVGYLPGDSISVTSLTTKTTVDILVIGSIDSSEGIAILLSPEAADLLGLSRDANNVVKITKRSGQLDEAVAGTAVIGGSADDSLYTDEDENSVKEPEYTDYTGADVDDDPFAEEETEIQIPDSSDEGETGLVGEPQTPLEAEPSDTEQADVAEEPEVEVIKAERNEEPEVPVSDLENEAVSSTDELYEDEFTEPDFADASETVVEPEVEETDVLDATSSEEENPLSSEPVFDEGLSDEPEYSAVSEPVEETAELPAEPDGLEAIAADDLSEEGDATAEEVTPDNLDKNYVEKVELVPATEEEPAEEPEVASENVDQETPVSSDETVGEEAVAMDNLDDFDSANAAEEVPPAADENAEQVAEAPFDESVTPNYEQVASDALDEEEVAATPFEEESYNAIVFVPSEENPPEPEQNDVAVTSEPEPASAEEEPTVPAVTATPEKSVAAPAKEFTTDDLSRFTVESLKDLKKGAYYIQIAVYGDENNVRAALKKYSAQYPMTLVPLANKKGTQVLVGPLNMDEYGTVLNRFKSYGFKDAFLRKIK